MNTSQANIVVIIILYIWSVFWKGTALWRAAKGGQKNWFIALIMLMPLNTLGILELIFLFKFAKHNLTLHEIKKWFNHPKL